MYEVDAKPPDEVYLKSATLANTVSEFKTSGVFPFIPEIIPKHEFIDDSRGIHRNTNKTEESNAALVTSTVIINDTTDCYPVWFDVCQNYSNNTDTKLASLADNTLIMLEVLQTKKCTNEDEPANENIMALPSKTNFNQIFSSACSFSDIVKIPKLNVSQKKSEKSEIITSSLYKRRLLKNIENGSKKKVPKNTKKAKQPRQKNQRTLKNK